MRETSTALPAMNGHRIRAFVVWLLFATGTSTSHGHGAYHDRLAQLDAQLAKDSRDPALWGQRVELHLGHDEWTLALKDLQKLEILAPDKFPTDWLKARAFAGEGQLEKAKELLDGFIEKNPRQAGALATRARVLMKLGRNDAALADFHHALSKNTEPPVDLVVDAAAAMQSAGQSAEAADLLDKAVARFGQTPMLLKASLAADLAARRHEAALKRIDEIQASAPRVEPWMAKRAEVLAITGRQEEARAAWTALKNHLAKLPNLERGNPEMRKLADAAKQALDSSSPGRAPGR